MVLTMGDRPVELQAALASVRRQRGVHVETVVVLNADAPDVPLADVGDARVVRPGRNLGIPGGRNLGVASLSGSEHGDDIEVVLFLDDDGELIGEDTLVRAVRLFARFERLAVVSLRIVDPATDHTERWYVPRLWVGDPTRSSWVTTFLGGASLHRVDAFVAAGGLPEEFVYAHEETSLAWRLLDRGWRLAYVGGLAMAHPPAPPARHAVYHYRTAHNRVLLARKHLPATVGVVYVLAWAALGLLRDRSGWRDTLRGFRDGLRADGVDRAPVRWRTVARMTFEGRPPLL